MDHSQATPTQEPTADSPLHDHHRLGTSKTYLPGSAPPTESDRDGRPYSTGAAPVLVPQRGGGGGSGVVEEGDVVGERGIEGGLGAKRESVLAGGGGQGPGISRNFMFITLCLAVPGWILALVSQAFVRSKLGNTPVGTLWLAILLQLYITLLILIPFLHSPSSSHRAGAYRSSLTDSYTTPPHPYPSRYNRTNRRQPTPLPLTPSSPTPARQRQRIPHQQTLTALLPAALVLGALGVDRNISPSHLTSQKALSAAWIILCVVDLLWILAITYEEEWVGGLGFAGFSTRGGGGGKGGWKLGAAGAGAWGSRLTPWGGVRDLEDAEAAAAAANGNGLKRQNTIPLVSSKEEAFGHSPTPHHPPNQRTSLPNSASEALTNPATSIPNIQSTHRLPTIASTAGSEDGESGTAGGGRRRRGAGGSQDPERRSAGVWSGYSGGGEGGGGEGGGAGGMDPLSEDPSNPSTITPTAKSPPSKLTKQPPRNANNNKNDRRIAPLVLVSGGGTGSGSGLKPKEKSAGAAGGGVSRKDTEGEAPPPFSQSQSQSESQSQSQAQSQQGTIKAEALFDYMASNADPNEISFSKGEVLEIIDRSGKWWEARRGDGVMGIAPSNYLRVISP